MNYMTNYWTEYCQCLGNQGSAPTIAVDNTNGCQLYLGKSSLDAAITTAKSSAVNVLVPGPADDSDPVSLLLPVSALACRDDTS